MLDALIIGAGTAGLSAARTIREGGGDYLVVDMKEEIGYPIRSTGGIARYFVEKLGMPYDESIIAAKIRTIAIGDDNENYATLKFDHDVGYVYDYPAMQKYMARDLNIQLNTRVTEIKYYVNAIGAIVNGRFVQARNIIIATGPRSPFMPSADYVMPDEDVHIGYEETRYADSGDYDLYLWFSKYAPKGYVWDFPDSNGKRRIGLGVPISEHQNLKKNLNDFTKLHPRLNGKIDHVISHQIPTAKPPKQVVFKNVMYIGDAARSCFASTGGGLQGAFWTGMAAGEAVLDDDPMEYQKTWNDEIYPLLLRHYKIKRMMYRMNQNHMDKIIDAMQTFKIKQENAVKEIPRFLLHTLATHPSLVSLLI